MNVTIGGAPAEIGNVTKDSFTALIPAGAQDGAIVITTPASQPITTPASHSPEFQIIILGPPVLRNFEPGIASPGELVELFGQNFDVDDLNNNFVTIGGTKAENVSAELRSDGETILRVKVPPYVNDSEIVVKTPAVESGGKGASEGGFQLKPIIETIHPKRVYVGDTLVVHGRGLMKGATAYATGNVQMSASVALPFSQIGDEQEVRFVVPEGAQSGPITIRQGPGGGVSSDFLEINRIEELQRSRQLFAKPFFWRTPHGLIIIHLECEGGLLLVTGSLNGHLENVGMCPIDVDVDPSTNHAFTVNAKAYPKEGISEIDLSDPTKPKFIRYVDSGGANPTRIKVLRGGKVAVETGQGIFAGDASRMDHVADGKVVAMLKEATGDDPHITVISSSGQDGSATATVTTIPAKGMPSHTILHANVTSAIQFNSKIYVANYGSDNLLSFDPRSNAKRKSIYLGAGAKPFDIAIDPSKNKQQLFVFGSRPRPNRNNRSAERYSRGWDRNRRHAEGDGNFSERLLVSRL